MSAAGTPSALADRIQAWLDAGGREKVREAVRRAMKQTADRNKARRLPDGFLDRRITI